MNSDRLKDLRLKYQSFTPLVCKDIGIRKFEFVANLIPLSAVTSDNGPRQEQADHIEIKELMNIVRSKKLTGMDGDF